MRLRVTKIKFGKSDCSYWIVYEEGNFDKPIGLLNKFEAKALVNNFVDEGMCAER